MNEIKHKQRILDDDRAARSKMASEPATEQSLAPDEPMPVSINVSQVPEEQTTAEPKGTRPISTESRSLGRSPTGAAVAAKSAQEEERTALFAPTESNELRSRWDSIQVGFVDEPRRTVKEADELVALTMKRLGEVFAEERRRLEQQWDRGDQVTTEDLRVALRRYRSFFSRLLTF